MKLHPSYLKRKRFDKMKTSYNFTKTRVRQRQKSTNLRQMDGHRVPRHSITGSAYHKYVNGRPYLCS